jgi:hypothetical protein
MQLRRTGTHVRKLVSGRDIITDKNMVHPFGETLTVLSGVGSVRLKAMEAKNTKEPIKVLGAYWKT